MIQQAKKVLYGSAALAAFAVGGAAIANAASSQTTTTTTTVPAPPGPPLHGSAAHEDAEKPVTGDAAAKAQAAAVKAVGGGTAGDVTTDFPGSGYEVTVTKSDGASVEVHLDGSFNVLQGRGGPGFGGPPHGGAAHESAEQPVTGSAATQAQAAAVKAVGGGTAGAVTTDFFGSGYEVTVTKADGTSVEVHLDSSFTVRQGPPPHGFGA